MHTLNGRSYALTIPDWAGQVAELPRWCTGAAASDICDCFVLTEAVYGTGQATHEYEATLGENSGLIAFAYLWRRFGPPWLGCDDHKDLVRYVLHTSHPEVFLSLRCSGSELSYNVGYLITKGLNEEWHKPFTVWEHAFQEWWWTHKLGAADQAYLCEGSVQDDADRNKRLAQHYWATRHNQADRAAAEAVIGPYPRERQVRGWDLVQHALIDALVELLRPVFIRDVPINILGRLPLDEDFPGEEAHVSPYAGYGVSKPAMDAAMHEDD